MAHFFAHAASFAEDVQRESLRVGTDVIQRSVAIVGAVLRIQAAARGTAVRRSFQRVSRAAVDVQKNYRRLATVRRVSRLFDAVMYERRRALFDEMATRIQAAFRGSFIRRHVVDTHQRRQYISAVAAVSAKMAADATEFNEKCAQQDARESEEHRMRSIRAFARLHHLSGTKAIPGIFAPKYPMIPATINGEPVDSVLRREGKRAARQATLSVTQPRTGKLPRIPSPQAASKPVLVMPSPLGGIRGAQKPLPTREAVDQPVSTDAFIDAFLE